MKKQKMTSWREFLDTIYSPGGQLIVLIALVIGMTTACAFGVPKTDDMAVGSFGALLAVLRNTSTGKATRTLESAPDQRLISNP